MTYDSEWYNRSEIAGMTVNERLHHVGLLDEFYAAGRRRDRGRMAEILRSVEIDNPDPTIDSVLAPWWRKALDSLRLVGLIAIGAFRWLVSRWLPPRPPAR